MARRSSLRWVTDETVSVVNIDPYSHWLLVHGRPFLPPIRAFNHLAVVRADEGFETLLKPDFMTNVARLDDGTLLEKVAKKLPAERVKEPDTENHVFLLPLPDQSVAGIDALTVVDRGTRQTLPQADEIDPARPLVITGIIDDHINVFHEAFTASGGTRIDFAWFQDGARRRREMAADGPGPSFGLELTKADIDGAVGTDEARLRAFGLVDFRRRAANPLAFRASHGTHVADIAAGAAPHAPGHRNWRIITVSVPSLVTFDTSGATLGPCFVAGMHYIIHRARTLAKAFGRRATLVINCSYGISAGPHDGTHFIEQAIEALVGELQDGADPEIEAVHVVLPAGNNNLDRGHAAVEAASATARTEIALPWRIQPDDRTASYLEIWMPPGAYEQHIDIAITPPGGDQHLHFEARSGARLLCENGIGEPGRVVARVHRSRVGGRVRFVLAVAPTASLNPALPTAPHGVWHVKARAHIRPGDRIEAWIHRDTSPIGAKVQGRQSYFDDPRYARFDAAGRALADDPPDCDCVVRRRGTISGIATGARAVVVAGYPADREGVGAAEYSASGFGDGRRDPAVAGLSDRSRVLAGVLAAGTLSGSRVAINGTSVAAPSAARRIAQHALSENRGLLKLVDTPRRAEDEAPRVGAGWLAPSKHWDIR